MSIEDSIEEIKKGLTGMDKIIPPPKEELPKFHYIHTNIAVPNPTITFQPYENPFTWYDLIAGIAMALGFIAFGFALRGL